MKHWIQAARLRTLPLSLSGIIVGSAYAYHQGYSNWKIVVLALLTTLGLQVLSNYANDYGDGIKGTDDNRIGEKRLVAAGIISAQQMKKAVVLTAIITFLIALALIYVAFGKENFVLSLVFILLGVGSIGAAIKYTVGKNAYGYSGFGDVFVFLFFGFIRKYKGLHNVIEAFNVISNKRDDVSLIICGESFWNTLDNKKLSTRIKNATFGLAKKLFLKNQDNEQDYNPLALIKDYKLDNLVFLNNEFVPKMSKSFIYGCFESKKLLPVSK